MDGGSSINLIYARILKAMSISLESLKPTDCCFHGTVPGSANYPLGKIKLDVCIGDSGNYRREKLEFKVMDWPSQYHTILGRPAFAKFMAVPHYAYLTLKIPGPKGTITVQGSFEVSNTCDKEFNRMAQTFGMTAEYARLRGETDHNVLPDVGRSLGWGKEFNRMGQTFGMTAEYAIPGFQRNSRLEENPGPPYGPEQNHLHSGQLGPRIRKHARRVPP
jgi:hypothetical protein